MKRTNTDHHHGPEPKRYHRVDGHNTRRPHIASTTIANHIHSDHHDYPEHNIQVTPICEAVDIVPGTDLRDTGGYVTKRHTSTSTATSTSDTMLLDTNHLPDFEPTLLAQQTPHPLDVTIAFEAVTHTYSVQYDPNEPFVSNDIISVSTLVHTHFPKFEPDEILRRMRRRRNWIQSPYYTMTDDAIKRYWEKLGRDASTRGTHLHFLLECHLNGYPLLVQSPFLELNEIQAYRRWYTTHFDGKGLIPFRTEFRMRSNADLKITGTADLLAIAHDHAAPSKTNNVLTLHMIDWKFSKDIKTRNPYETGYGPCHGLDNCNYNHYMLQQNIYTWLLETFYSHWTWRGHLYNTVKVETMHLAVFHPNHNPHGYVYIPLPRRHDLVSAVIDTRRQYLTPNISLSS